MTFDRSSWTPAEWAYACEASTAASHARRARARLRRRLATVGWLAVTVALGALLYAVAG